MSRIRYVLPALLFAIAAGRPQAAHGPQTTAGQVAATGPSSAPFWTGMTSVRAFEQAMDGRLAHARALLAELTAPRQPRTIENTLRVFDDLQLELDAVASQSQLIESVHPDSGMRDMAEKSSQKASALNTEV